MRIIHCSDLHLDSRMEANLSPRQAKQRNAEICASFERMVDYARKQKVDAVMIAGDLFDTQYVHESTASLVLDKIAAAPEVAFFYLRGNHDEASAFEARTWPENLKFFGPEWTYYHFGDVTIAGMEPDGKGWERMYDGLCLDDASINIVLLHGQIATQPGPEQIALPKLRGKKIRYLALGHIHRHQSGALDAQGEYCYCGCLEGRGFDECGDKGFVLLQIQNGRLMKEFVPFASRTLYEVEVDLTDLTTVSQIRRAMETASANLDARSLVKFTLTGTYTPETQKDLDYLRDMMTSRFWFVKIKDESRFQIEKESYEHDVSLKGEFIRLVMASDKSDADKARIICCGIQALSGEEVTL